MLWGRVCKYMHEKAILCVLPQGQTVQKGGSNPPNPRQITPWLEDVWIPSRNGIREIWSPYFDRSNSYFETWESVCPSCFDYFTTKFIYNLCFEIEWL